MNGIRRTFSFRKKKKKSESVEGSKPQQWLDDEAKIKEGNCSFQVKYLGNIEVYESRGMQVCEEAIKALRKSKKKPQKAILFVSGDALRVSDDVSQHLIVDQTIEKVSFCAPDRSHDKGFAYICRDGATRRWMCHAFLAVKDSGERLSHAVGCAFAICLEKKQKRERDALQMASSDDRSFSRVGSFRPASLVERLIDPQSAIVVEPVTGTGDEKGTSSSSVNPNVLSVRLASGTTVPQPTSTTIESLSPSSRISGAIPRPRPSPSILERQGSLRLFPKLQATSPFKRDLSLRLEQLPSNLQRLTRITNGDTIPEECGPDSDELSTRPPPVTCVSQAPSSLTFAQSTIAKPVAPTTTLLSPSNNEPLAALTALPAATTTVTFPNSLNSVTPFQTTPPVPSFPDPFSAAPFNPASIQHCQALPEKSWSELDALTNQFNSVSLVTTCPSGHTDPGPTTTMQALPGATPTSPFLGGPPIAAPMSPSFAPVSWPGNGSVMRFSTIHPPYNPGDLQMNATDPYSRFATGGYGTGLPAVANSLSWLSGSQSTTSWSSPLPSLLPPEPDRLTDPFDVRWAERATSTATLMSTHKPGNPFLSDDATSNPAYLQLNGNSPTIPANSLVS